jgi:hypothetical protein
MMHHGEHDISALPIWLDVCTGGFHEKPHRYARANASKMFANIPLCADVDKSVKIDHCL